METEQKKQTPETPAKKRGRPRKIQEPVVNEAPIPLQMTQTDSRPTTNLTSNSKRAYGQRTMTGFVDLNKYNPFTNNQRLKSLATQPGEVSRETLLKALCAPQNNESILRSQSASMASKQYMYYKILRLACDIPLYKWYVTPEMQEDKSIYKKDDFVEEDKFVNEWLKAFDLTNTLKRVALEVSREGKTTYLLRNSVSCENKKKSVNFAAWQKLPTEYLKLVKIGSHGFIASFNMMLFLNPIFSIEQYPDFLQEVWYDMIEKGIVYQRQDAHEFVPRTDRMIGYSYEYSNNGAQETLSSTLEVIANDTLNTTYAFWVQLPQDMCYTFSSDTSTPWVIPDTAGLLLSLDELADYDTLQGLIDSTPLTALLTAEAEAINDPNPGLDQTVLSPETITGLQDLFNSSSSTNLEALFAPLKNFKLLSLPSQPNSSEISTIATKNIVSRSGLGGVLITTDKPPVSQIKASLALEESKIESITKQFESVLNMIINKLLGCRYKWNLHIWGNAFTFADEFKRDKEMLASGFSIVLPKICSAYDMTMREAKGILDYTDSLDIYSGFKTVTQVNQEKLNEEQNATGEVGRPKKDAGEIDNDNTAQSQESGLDTADTRYDHECLICGEPCVGKICPSCEEELANEE